jgi:hypothetical protein
VVNGSVGQLPHSINKATSHQIVPGAGCGNVFHGNDSDLGGASGYAIDIPEQSACSVRRNVVYSSNTVRNSGKGLTNIPVIQGG